MYIKRAKSIGSLSRWSELQLYPIKQYVVFAVFNSARSILQENCSLKMHGLLFARYASVVLCLNFSLNLSISLHYHLGWVLIRGGLINNLKF